MRAVLGKEWKLRQEQPTSHENSEPEPDIAIVSARAGDYAYRHPATAELVIEVAISSVEIDHRKRAIYAGAGVREHWIICRKTDNSEFTLARWAANMPRKEFAPFPKWSLRRQSRATS